MDTIRVFFSQIRTIFFNFQKRAREVTPSPTSPSLVTCLISLFLPQSSSSFKCINRKQPLFCIGMTFSFLHVYNFPLQIIEQCFLQLLVAPRKACFKQFYEKFSAIFAILYLGLFRISPQQRYIAQTSDPPFSSFLLLLISFISSLRISSMLQAHSFNPNKTIIRDNAGTGYDYLSDDFQLQKSTNILKLEILTKLSCSVMWIMLRKISFLSILSKLCFLLGIKVQHWILELSANRIDSDIPIQLNHAGHKYLAIQLSQGSITFWLTQMFRKRSGYQNKFCII